jgi:hypothetical protein
MHDTSAEVLVSREPRHMYMYSTYFYSTGDRSIRSSASVACCQRYYILIVVFIVYRFVLSCPDLPYPVFQPALKISSATTRKLTIPCKSVRNAISGLPACTHIQRNYKAVADCMWVPTAYTAPASGGPDIQARSPPYPTCTYTYPPHTPRTAARVCSHYCSLLAPGGTICCYLQVGLAVVGPDLS